MAMELGFRMRASAWRSIESFDLGGTLRPMHARLDMFTHIRNMERLQNLNLHDVAITRKVLEPLILCMNDLSCLSYLGLAACEFKDVGVLRLAPEIEKMGALRDLHMRDNGTTYVGWEALVPVLHRGPAVVCLRADMNVQTFAEAFPGSMHHVDVLTEAR